MYDLLSTYARTSSIWISNFCHFVLIIACVFIGLFLLTKGGDLLSDYCSSLAEELGVPSVVVGLTIVSIATSAPELFTSICGDY